MDERDIQKLAAASRYYLEKDAWFGPFKKKAPTATRRIVSKVRRPGGGYYHASGSTPTLRMGEEMSKAEAKALGVEFIEHTASINKEAFRKTLLKLRHVFAPAGTPAPEALRHARKVRTVHTRYGIAKGAAAVRAKLANLQMGYGAGSPGATTAGAASPPPPKTKAPNPGVQFAGTTPAANGGMPPMSKAASDAMSDAATVIAGGAAGGALGALTPEVVKRQAAEVAQKNLDEISKLTNQASTALNAGNAEKALVRLKGMAAPVAAASTATSLAKSLARYRGKVLPAAAALGALGGGLGTAKMVRNRNLRQAMMGKEAASLTPLKAAVGAGIGFGAGFGIQRYREAKPGPQGYSRGEKEALLDLHRQLMEEQVKGGLEPSDIKQRSKLVGNLAAKAEQRKDPLKAALTYGATAAAVGAGTGGMASYLAPKIIKAIRNVR